MTAETVTERGNSGAAMFAGVSLGRAVSTNPGRPWRAHAFFQLLHVSSKWVKYPYRAVGAPPTLSACAHCSSRSRSRASGSSTRAGHSCLACALCCLLLSGNARACSCVRDDVNR